MAGSLRSRTAILSHALAMLTLIGSLLMLIWRMLTLYSSHSDVTKTNARVMGPDSQVSIGNTLGAPWSLALT